MCWSRPLQSSGRPLDDDHKDANHAMNASSAPRPPAASLRNEASELRNLVRHLTGRHIERGTVDGDLYRVMLAEFEGPLLAEVLERCGNNQSQAASLLGLSRGTLRVKLRRHGLLGARSA